MMFKNKKLITHNGSFHADDIFACATLSLVLEKNKEKFKVLRTRDEEIIKNADYVFDVGGIYDEKINRFDHHQKGGAGQRGDGIPYSSFGLVWKKFGEELCGSKEIAEIIDTRLVQPVDAFDNGVDLVKHQNKILPYLIQDFFFAMRPTWKEGDLSLDSLFLRCVSFAKEILMREMIQAKDLFLAKRAVVSIYNNTADKRIIVLDKNYPYEEILDDFPEPLFVVYPRSTGDSWGVKTMRKYFGTFESKKSLPSSWSGLRNEELQKVSGVDDAMFCHLALFLAVAKSKEGAIKMAQIAVES